MWNWYGYSLLLKGKQDVVLLRENLKFSKWSSFTEKYAPWGSCGLVGKVKVMLCISMAFPAANTQQAVCKRALFCMWGRGQQHPHWRRDRFQGRFQCRWCWDPSLASCELQATGHGARKQEWALGRFMGFFNYSYSSFLQPGYGNLKTWTLELLLTSKKRLTLQQTDYNQRKHHRDMSLSVSSTENQVCM